eukprot:GILI01027350.1.p1 GENE.GILI01027350.1~~GILI01027350.1.p1  ORF type:complete len:262 (+),score=7.97 GILI01027350.1:51-836(+)
MAILRKLGRAFIIGASCQTCINTAMLGYSYFGTDYVQRERLQNAAHASMSPVASSASRSRWPFSGYLAGGIELSEDEKACVDSMTRVLSMDYSNQNLSKFTKNVLFNDPLICFDGISEMKDAWKFLWLFVERSQAVATEIRRDVDSTGGVVLHVAYETDAAFKFNLFTWTFHSHVTLILDNDRNALNTASSYIQYPRIQAVEHRFYGGPILSRMTSSQENILGDIGDICRRINGFAMSLILTARTEDGTKPRITPLSRTSR